MKKGKTPAPAQDDIRTEYDFTGVPGVRGKHAAAYRQGYTQTVQHPDGTQEVTTIQPLDGSIILAPDVQAYFPDAEAVNTALRGLIALRPRRRPRKTTS